MAVAVHDRVRVHKPGDPLHNFVGSVTAVYANNTADVQLDDGRDRGDGGTLPPGPHRNFAAAELFPG